MNTRHLDYTPDGQIKSIKNIKNNKEMLIATYQYNHLRQRVSKTTYHQDDKTGQTKEDITQYLWDKGLLSAEIKDNKITRRYIYLDIMPVAVLDYGYDNKGKLNETRVYSVHTDHLGTPKQITNQNQETVWQIDLDTFGETKDIQAKTITDPNTNTQKPFEFNLRFAGQYHDTETGYHYNYHRYYDPKVGRYLTSDPIGLAGGLNSYGYANSEPWGVVDPYGLYTLDFAKNRLEASNVKPEFPAHMGPTPSTTIPARYSSKQIFEEWYRLEKANLAKPNNWATNLLRCPRKIETGKGANNGPQWLKVQLANQFHKPGVWEMRSVTVGESSNQCIYDENGNIMLEIPATGTTDRCACPHLGKCWDYTWHDLEPWRQAKTLDKQCGENKYKKMYYEVRPILANTGGAGGNW